MECIIGGIIICKPGATSSLRLVMLNLILSPTRARITGPGTWSPNVQPLNFTPGAISMILCVVSSWMVFTGDGSRGFISGAVLSPVPDENPSVCRSLDVLDGGG